MKIGSGLALTVDPSEAFRAAGRGGGRAELAGAMVRAPLLTTGEDTAVLARGAVMLRYLSSDDTAGGLTEQRRADLLHRALW